VGAGASYNASRHGISLFFSGVSLIECCQVDDTLPENTIRSFRWPSSRLSGYRCLLTVHWHQSPSARWYMGALEVSLSSPAWHIQTIKDCKHTIMAGGIFLVSVEVKHRKYSIGDSAAPWPASKSKNSFWATVCKTVCPMLLVRCLSVVSVRL